MVSVSKEARQRLKSMPLAKQKEVAKASALLYDNHVITFARYRAITRLLDVRAVIR